MSSNRHVNVTLHKKRQWLVCFGEGSDVLDFLPAIGTHAVEQHVHPPPAKALLNEADEVRVVWDRAAERHALVERLEEHLLFHRQLLLYLNQLEYPQVDQIILMV